MGNPYFPPDSDSTYGEDTTPGGSTPNVPTSPGGNDPGDSHSTGHPEFPAGSGAPGAPPASGVPPMPQQWTALIEAHPKWAGRIRSFYRTAWANGDDMKKAFEQLTKLIERQIQKKKDARAAEEEYDPWLNNISSTYFDIWGEEIPESEVEYAKSEGMNAFEFVEYQRSKSAFTSTQLYENESTGLAGQVAQLFGWGGSFSGSQSPLKGSGANGL